MNAKAPKICGAFIRNGSNSCRPAMTGQSACLNCARSFSKCFDGQSPVSEDFRFDITPFDELGATEQALVRESAQRVSWNANDILLTPLSVPQHLWLLTSGHVQ